MTTALDLAAAVAPFACFAVFVIASVTMFRKDRGSRGYTLIQALSVSSIAANVFAWAGGPVAVPALSLAALALAIISCALFFAGRAVVGDMGLDVAFTGDGPEQLATTGVYRMIRNPLYAAYIFHWFGWAVLLGFSAPALIAALVLLYVYHRAAEMEEAFLASRFGTEYARYRERSGRFLPRVHWWRGA